MYLDDERAENIARNVWVKKYKSFNKDRATYDGWMDNFKRALDKCDTPIIDLGCGNGNNALHLARMGKEVIACDYTQQALDLIKENMPEVASTLCFDMRDGLPFEDNFTDIIIADLSLHYFTENDTFELLKEIKRVLKPSGLLLFRVNSTKDINWGALDGKEVERNYRRTEEFGDKRYFDSEDLDHFFQEFEFIYKREEIMKDRYEKPKVLWRCVVCNRK